MDLWNKGTLKSLFLPGGVLLLGAVLFLEGGFVPISASAVDFYYYAVFAAGLLLTLRFQSSRILFALITLLLSHRAVEFFSAARTTLAGPGRTAFEAVALLLPLNFIVFSFIRERGLAVSTIASRAALLFLESVFVAVICRPGEITGPAFLHPVFLDLHWTKVPSLALLAFAMALVVLVTRFLLYRKPVESGLLWALIAAFLAFKSGEAGRISSAYVATAGLILAGSIIENSYLLAYQDELTGLPARRAFNEAVLRLEAPYAIAVVDIDHFKKVNDTHGHETGDHVLRMVATRLARATGGGRAFRVGGEEFSILYPGKATKEVVEDLELLRAVIEGSSFYLRSGQERRRNNHRARDRRASNRQNASHSSRAVVRPSRSELSVTVSIGVAEPTTRSRHVEQVIQAADKALYRAKQAGRNRVETATASHPPRLKASIA